MVGPAHARRVGNGGSQFLPLLVVDEGGEGNGRFWLAAEEDDAGAVDEAAFVYAQIGDEKAGSVNTQQIGVGAKPIFIE